MKAPPPAPARPTPTPHPPLLVVGSSNTDLTIRVARIPRSGETILGGQYASAAGGKGANQAVAAARAGGSVTFVARLGQDALGAAALAGFAAAGINTRHVVRDPAHPSGTALIIVGRHGENCIAVASGANSHLTPADVRKAADAFRHARAVLVQLEIPLPAVETAVRLAAAAAVPVILNPAPARKLPARLLPKIFLLTPNETEAEILTGIRVRDEASAARAAERLRARGVQNVIITLGARGAWISSPAVCGRIPAFKVKPVDATGAGDVFNGALAVALAEGKSLLDAARFAAAAAAISVTRRGAQPSIPVRAEIEKLLATSLRRTDAGRVAPQPVGAMRRQPRRAGAAAGKSSRPLPRPDANGHLTRMSVGRTASAVGRRVSVVNTNG
jgi:ribokinase